MPLEIAKDTLKDISELPPQEPSTEPVRGFFTAEETATLQKWLPRFQQTKRSNGKKFVGFWEPFEKEFFDEHPQKDLTAEQIAAGLNPTKSLARVRKVSEGLASIEQLID